METDLGDGREVVDEEELILDWLASFPLRSLSMNMDNWEKMLSIESFKSIVMNFLHNPQLERIYFLNADGIILPCEKLTQHNGRSRIVMCQRITAEVVTLNNYKEIVKFGDFPANILDYLDVYTNYIQIPLLSHPSVMASLPELMQKELQSNLQELKSLIDVTREMKNGQEDVRDSPDSQTFALHCRSVNEDGVKMMLTWEKITSANQSVLVTEVKSDLVDYMANAEDLKKILKDYESLERVEFGGIQGKEYSRQMQKIYAKFQTHSQLINDMLSNTLGVGENLEKFERVKDHFLRQIERLDEEIATILQRVISRSTNIQRVINTLTTLGDFIHRPIINRIYREHFTMICEVFEQEIGAIDDIFDAVNEKVKHIDDFQLNRKASTTSGVLEWINQLKRLLRKPFDQLTLVVDTNGILTTVHGRRVMAKFENVSGKLSALEVMMLSKWKEEAIDGTMVSYAEPLIVLNTTGIPNININYNLSRIMRDCRIIQQLKYDLPEEIVWEFRERFESFWMVKNKLLSFCEKYRFVRTEMNEYELAVIKDELRAIDDDIEVLIEKDSWGNFDTDRIAKLEGRIDHLHGRMIKVKENMEKIIKHLEMMKTKPLYSRKDQLPNTHIVFNERSKILPLWFWNCIKLNKLIKEVLTENFQLLTDTLYIDGERSQEVLQNPKRRDFVNGFNHMFIDSFARERLQYYWSEIQKIGSTDDAFIMYKNSIDKMLYRQLGEILRVSLNHLENEFTNARNEEKPPIIEINLIAEGEFIIFEPSMEINNPSGLYRRFSGVIHDIASLLKLIVRVNHDSWKERTSEDEIPTFWSLYPSISELKQVKKLINGLIASVMESVNECYDMYGAYEKLLITNKANNIHNYVHNRVNLPFWQTSPSGTSSELEFDENQNYNDYKVQFDRLQTVHETISQWQTRTICKGWLIVNSSKLKQDLLQHINMWTGLLKAELQRYVDESLRQYKAFFDAALRELDEEIDLGDFEKLKRVLQIQRKIANEREKEENGVMFNPLIDIVKLLKSMNIQIEENILEMLETLPAEWMAVKLMSMEKKEIITSVQKYQMDMTRKMGELFVMRLKLFTENCEKSQVFTYPCENVYDSLDGWMAGIEERRRYHDELVNLYSDFGMNFDQRDNMTEIGRRLRNVKHLWDAVAMIEGSVAQWRMTLWSVINLEEVDQECRVFLKYLRTLDKSVHQLEPFLHCESMLKSLMASLRTVMNLHESSIKERHWDELRDITGENVRIEPHTRLQNILDYGFHRFEESVNDIVEKSVQEQYIEMNLAVVKEFWNKHRLDYEEEKKMKIQLPKWNEEMFMMLDNHLVQLHNIVHSRFVGGMAKDAEMWRVKLDNVSKILNLWFEIQRKWIYMEGIFMWSEDIRVKIPGETSKFASVASQLRLLVGQLSKNKLTIEIASYGNLLSELQNADTELTAIEKVLNEYLEGKRKDFPRFYFISSADLLDILTCANAQDVFRHLPKLFDSVKTLEMRGVDALQMVSKEDESVTFQGAFKCSGAVEVWLNTLISEMRRTLRHVLGQAVAAYRDKPRHEWLHDWPAQPALCASQIWWAAKVERAFRWLEEGNENAMKNYQERQKKQLSELINMLIGELTMAERQKIMTICTIDVHSRDVVAKLIADRIDSVTAFQWQSQLRHRWDEDANDCFANICDAQFPYDHEYLGNTPRLVVTPLTDKCYITLTQSLHLFMGGAPAGPAGTGKTETTKDLGRALGMMVYVFNCSEQMDYKSCGNIYKGLAQTGAFGCFDEFNRISVEVLSVVAIQVKTILDALKTGRTTFNFFGETIKLVPTVGIFITMNPGYAGRTELPENLKALFRPCSMIVPDIELICEILLVAEGFQSARALARKFISLYSMCRELLSKQDHYDWGLRAVKSVLVVAGSLKRADPDRSEDEILMRALRDFNTPKITVDDTPVFLGLIGDLFPALDVPRQRNEDFEEIVKLATVDLSLQPEPGFVQKVTELEEILQIRHSVFIVGAAGVGKSCVWKTLFRTYERLGRDPVYDDLNPKAVTNDELFGVVNAGTREWQDGLFSIIMRDQAYASNVGPKWIVCDGDIDPMWIESLNTVMDDNKVLTLANNERIALTPSMRLLFEISHLRAATPATVSRAGIIYINSRDVGYQPLVVSWLERRESDAEKIILSHLFNKYVPMILEALHTRFTTIIPLVDVALVHTTCSLLDSLLTRENVPQNSPNEWYEMYFVFAAIWGFGGALFRDQQRDWRLEFHRWWVRTFKTIKFPSADATIFDYHIDPDTKKFTLWNCLRDEFRFYAEIPLQMTFVDTEDTARVQYLLRLLIHAGHPAMVVGGGGCGKTMVVQRQLSGLPSDYMSANIPVNLYTTSRGFQESLEMQLERTSARSLTPRNGRKLIYFVDDINLPQVDLYGTVAPHTLLRQFFDYRHWYERDKYILKNIQNCSVVATMNPNVGSFTINPRLQRHFATVALDFPSSAHLQFIYSSILRQHLENKANKFTQPVQNICTNVVKSIMDFHLEVSQIFLPTSTKFHYNFNLHDITNVFQGLIFSRHSTCPKKEDFFKLLIHELHRVYADKLVSREDLRIFDNLIATAVEKAKDYMDEDVKLPHPLLYFHYANSLNDSEYSAVDSWQHLNALLEEAQVNYREIVGASNLVLFEDAMAHVCRIIRILESTRGHAMLVGVGGSGKRSLTRLSAFISSLPVEQIQLSSDYGVAEFKGDLAVMYKKTGVKTTKSCLMMSDAQIPTEEFVMIINDILTTGECVNLLPPEDVDEIVQQVRSAAKQQGFGEDRSSCWRFFIDRVRNNLKIILCLSPVGGTLRQRARKFPGIFSNCRIIWFHDWPTEALVSVAERFLTAFDLMPHEYVRTVSNFLAKAHNSVNEVSTIYRETEKRFNYTTPKTFLDTIDLYRKLFRERKEKITQWINRLDQGLIKLDACTAQVDVLKETLAEQEATTTQKKDEADIVLQFLQKENAVVSLDRANVAEEEKNVRKIEANIAETTRQCEAEVKLAEPAINQAKEALNTLDKKNLTELKSFGTPPPGVEKVTEAVLILFAKGNIPKDRSWKACRAMMGKADTFLNQLKTFDKENIRKETISAILPYVENRDFKPEKMKAKSSAAAGLCAWVINIYKFYQVYSEVKPKLIALDSAKKQLAEEQAKLGELSGKLSVLEEKLSKLESKLQLALDEQKACQDEVDRTENALDLANRLIVGLASERVRWKKFIVKYREQMNTTLGDTLIGACFISYLGCFTQSYREKIITDYWLPALMTLEPSLLTGEDLVDLNPFLIVCDTAMVAEWNNEGLPSDRMSVDNAMILLSSVRWPLIIDPELQGLRWIRRRFGDDLVVTRLDAEDCLSVVEQVVRVGGILLLENVDETLNPMLSNLFGRVLTRGGQAVMLGDREIVYNPAFRLILQTKLSNPHYQPEVQAQLTLINFTVTREGLEDQLLVDVVKLERPELEEQQHQLTVQRNEFKIQLKDLEDKLLERLSGETGNILQNSSLVENVEDNKRLAEEIEIRSAEARETAKEITAARELYRDVAKRAAILYFVLKGMHWVNPIYQYSMELFRRVFVRAILDTQVEDTVRERVNALIENITYQVYEFVSRGMFKKDKSLLLVHIFLQLYVHSKEYNPIELGFLLRCPAKAGVKSPVPFLTNANWGGMCALAELESFRDIDKDIEESSKRWRLIVASEVAENEKFPGNWRNMNSVQKLCILRVIRPDRMVYACYQSAIDRLGPRFRSIPPPEMSKIFQVIKPQMP